MGRLTITGQVASGVLENPIGVGSLRVTGDGTVMVFSESLSGWATLTPAQGTLASVTGSGLTTGSEPTQSLDWRGTLESFAQEDIDAVLASTTGQSISIYADRSGFAGDRFEAMAFERDGQTFVVLSKSTDEGLTIFSADGAGQLTYIDYLTDGTSAAAEQIHGMTTFGRGTQVFTIVAAQGEDGVAIYRQKTSDNTLVLRSSIAADEFLPVGDPTAVEYLSFGGKDFAILASTGSSTITVFEIDADLQLVGVDQVIDELDTRFDAVTAMDVFTHNGAAYVIVGGADDGVTLFRMLSDGRLIHLDTIEDTVTAGLANVAEIRVVTVGTEVQAFVTSTIDDGITQITLNLSADGDEIRATGGTTVGTVGDDIIIDRDGTDTLTGGAGADTFVFFADTSNEEITDFEFGVDRLDLSGLGFVRDISQIAITSTATGAILAYGGYQIQLYSHDGSSYDPADFTNADILNASHIDLSYLAEFTEAEIQGTEFAETVVGTDADQTVLGFAGDDFLRGLDGADVLDGGLGEDLADYVNSTVGLTVSLDDPTLNTGEAEGDTYIDIEGIRGSDLDDLLIGDASGNDLRARGGNDTVEGRDGNDDIRGDTGNDRLDGGEGNDTLNGDEGNDALLGRNGNDLIYGGEGDDNIAAHAGNDTVYGEAGNDSLGGSDGDDWMYGGTGSDTIGSGSNNDFIDAGDGDDVASGGWGTDEVRGGAGNDTLAGSFGFDTVRGEDGDDSLGGGALTDYLYGDDGNDQLGCGDGDDFGYGGIGNDFIGGGAGNDQLFGEDGLDTINGGSGDDTMSGGADADTFVFNSFINGEVDLITDFTDGEDVFRMRFVSGRYDGLDITDTDVGGVPHASIEYDGQVILLTGITASQIDPSDFIFIG